MKTLITTLSLLIILSGCQKLALLPPVIPPPIIMPENAAFTLQCRSLADTLQADGNIVVFNKAASLAYVPGEDAPYQLSGAGMVTVECISYDNIPLAYDNLPYTKGMTIKLFTSVKKAGNYAFRLSDITANFPAGIHIYLTDGVTQTDLKTGEYDFTANGGSLGNRFNLLIK